MPGPLQGIRVLDLARYQAGPVCALMLADMGAEVIKVEHPDGEDGRRVPPYGAHSESLYFQVHNRNKSSITANLQTADGKEVLRDLIRVSDVLIENYRVGVIQRLGFDYQAVRALNPAMVMTSITGFGQYGPYAKRTAHDMIIHAMSGVMSLNGFPDKPPVKVGISIADYCGGFFGAMGTMFALFERERSGKGQYVDVAMMDALVFQLEYFLLHYLVNGELTPRVGNRRPMSAPNGAYKARDGYVYIAASGDVRWARLCRAMELPQLATDLRYATALTRRERHDEIDAVIEAWTATKTTAELEELLEAASVPAGVVRTLDQIARDPQVLAREMIVNIGHPILGRLPLPGVVAKLSRTPGSVRQPAPMLGQDNNRILGELLSFPGEKLRAMEKAGAI